MLPFVQARNFTRGRRTPIDLIVLHSMEAAEKPGTAAAVAAWFAGPHAPRASAHYCIDPTSVVQCVKDTDTAWHAPGANHNGLGIEHAGYARQTAGDWDDEPSRAILRLSTELVAGLCRQWVIPPVIVDAAGLLRGERGITTHAAVSQAFRRSSHWDPGPGFPLEAYAARVAELVACPAT